MKPFHRALLPAALAVSFLCASGFAQPLVLDQKSDVRIVEYGAFGNTQGWSRDLLAKYLLRALDRTDLKGPGAPVTFVIESRAASWKDIPRDQIKAITDIDAFEIAVMPGKEGVVRITGATATAAGYGVMRFLEKQIGITWLFPGELGLALPEAKTFSLAAQKERIAPAFMSRVYTGFILNDPTLPAKKYVYSGVVHEESVFYYVPDYFKSLMLRYIASPSHFMIYIFPPEMEKDHPEIFPIKDGKRWFPPAKDSEAAKVGAREAWHPCYTNPTTLRIAIESARAAFDKGEYCFSLGINDGQRIQCQCDECRRIGFPRTYYQFVTKVAEAVKDYYPPRLIGVLSYGDVKTMPADMTLPENVLAVVTGGRLGEWENRAKHLGTYEYDYGTGFWVPNFPLKALAVNARTYQRLGAKFFRAEVCPLWAFDGPKMFILNRLLWDPSLDVDALLKRYCDAAFGPGSPAMVRFYKRWATLRGNDPEYFGIMPTLPMSLWRNSSGQFAQCTPEDYAFNAGCLAEAGRATLSDGQRQRLEMVQTFFDYSRVLFEMTQFCRKAYSPAPEEVGSLLAGIRQRADARQALIEKMRKHPEWFLGTSDTLDSILGPTWEGGGGWTLNNNTDSGIKTALLTLAEAGKAAALQADLPDTLKLFAALPERKAMVVHKRPTHPWYGEARYVPMDVAVEGNQVTFKTTPTTQRIPDGADAGTWKQHYGLALFDTPPMNGRKIFLVEMTLRGQKGSLTINTLNNGAADIGSCPHAITEPFGDEVRDVTLRYVVEPVFPKSPWITHQVVQDIHLMWKPAGDDSLLSGSYRVWSLQYPAP